MLRVVPISIAHFSAVQSCMHNTFLSSLVHIRADREVFGGLQGPKNYQGPGMIGIVMPGSMGIGACIETFQS